MTELLSTGGWPTRLLTLADWEALPEDEACRVEVSEGVLHVVPQPHRRHQRLVNRLTSLLDLQLPDDVTALIECDVVLDESPLTVRAPDVLVTTSSAYESDAARLIATDLLLAVEVISPGSRRTDRVTKASEYAEAGIPEYWIVDPDDPVTLTCLTLGEERTYVASGDRTGHIILEVAGTSIDIDLAALVR